MKYAKRFIIVFSVLGIALCCGFGNLGKELRFSAPSGFYDQPFYLEISAGEESEIYYTLNGSTPDRDSLATIKYEGPIYLENVTDRDNVWASASDMSEYFYDERPAYKVDKGNIIRAIAYDREGEASEVLSGTYFIGLPKEKYENIAVVSLIADPDDLWGYEKGIYIKGISQERFPELTDPETVEQTDYAANYNMRGREWERICDTEWFFPENTDVIKQTAGIRVKGNYSRNFAQKSFNLFARKEYGKSKFEFDFWNNKGNRETESSITLFAGGCCDKRTKLKDALVGKLASELDVTVAKTRPCVVFLDGEYWGLYQIMQRTKTDYLQEHYGIAADNLTLVEKQVDILVEGDPGLYEELLSYIRTNDLNDEQAYQQVCEMVDMQSLMDYFAVNIYIGNTDWPNNNAFMWRSNQVGRRREEDAKWRWIIYDVNDPRCMDYKWVGYDMTQNAREDELFSALLDNAKFRQEFYENFMRIEKEIFDPGHVNEVLFGMAEEIGLQMQEDYIRFPNQYTIENNFVDSVLDISNYFSERNKYINGYVKRMLEEYE